MASASTMDTSSNPFQVIHGAHGSAKPSGRSMFGSQAESRRPNAPSFSFSSTCSRDQASKVFLSPEHVEVVNKCSSTPGAKYDLPSSIDKQVLSSKETAPRFTFSTTDRTQKPTSAAPPPGSYDVPSALGPQPLSRRQSLPVPEFSHAPRDKPSKLFLSDKHADTQKGTQGAPPGSYHTPGALGPQMSSLRHSVPAFTLPKSDRLKEKYEKLSKTLPPVGSYETWQSIGKQTLSSAKTSPAVGFGSSTWKHEAARFISPGHTSHERKGTASPANYNHQQPAIMSSFIKPTISTQRSAPAFGFGSSPKGTLRVSDTPGPGSYD